VMMSVSKQVLNLAVKRRQEEKAKEQALAAIAKELDNEGFFKKPDPVKLEAAIDKAEAAGCVPQQLEKPRAKLAQLKAPKQSFWKASVCCAATR